MGKRIECEQSTLAADVVLEGGGRMDPCEGGAGATGHLPNGKGGILYCVIARGATVLARHASCVGNFAEISDLVLAKVGFAPQLFD